MKFLQFFTTFQSDAETLGCLGIHCLMQLEGFAWSKIEITRIIVSLKPQVTEIFYALFEINFGRSWNCFHCYENNLNFVATVMQEHARSSRMRNMREKYDWEGITNLIG